MKFFRTYGYDSKGQVTSGTKAFPDGSAIPGHGFAYAYDGIGNRESAVNGGGSDTDVSYATNALNQYTSVGTDGGRFILGEAPAASPVTINDTIPAARAGGLGFFWHRITGTNASAPLWSQDKVSIPGKAPQQGLTLTPLASVVPTHDFDGNLTYDGRWRYTWSAENRLILMQNNTVANGLAGIPNNQIDFIYDAEGRMVSRSVSTGGSFGTNTSRRFLYLGWNVVAGYSANSPMGAPTLDVTHLWGPDLSGSFDGAGGVGGLLAVHQGAASSLAGVSAYDASGNITGWLDSSGQMTARMEYDPFGNRIVKEGSFESPFGFSTKYQDKETELYYYGYRYYQPQHGRWINRDPIGERGGVGLYGFVVNNPLNSIGVLGLVQASGTLYYGQTHGIRGTASNSQRYNQWIPRVAFIIKFSNPSVYSSDGRLLFSPGKFDDDIRIKQFAQTVVGSDKESEPSDQDNSVTMIYGLKRFNDWIGGPQLKNIASPLDRRSGYCVECVSLTVDFYHKEAMESLGASLGGPVSAVLDVLPISDAAGGIIEGLENTASLIDEATELLDNLQKTRRVRMRATICADGARQISVFNVPKMNVDNVSGDLDKVQGYYHLMYSGSWVGSDPGGNSGLIRGDVYSREEGPSK